jgi:hypothetical protein
MLEHYLIAHCSPTLAGLKTANLFNCPFSSLEELNQVLYTWNRVLNGKGIFLELLHICNQKALIYVYRWKRLLKDLKQAGVWGFLQSYGYQSTSTTQDILLQLSRRIEECDGFPHEIGAFLGYPLGDVQGFIQNKGKNCLCCGFWKVYCNECEALRQFAKFEKCREIYAKHFTNGKTIQQLTVAA